MPNLVKKLKLVGFLHPAQLEIKNTPRETGLKIVNLRMIVPLGSYIRNSLRFLCYASLSTCSQNLEKIWVTGKIWEKAELKMLRDLTDKSVSFSTLVTSNIRLSLFLGEVN